MQTKLQEFCSLRESLTWQVAKPRRERRCLKHPKSSLLTCSLNVQLPNCMVQPQCPWDRQGQRYCLNEDYSVPVYDHVPTFDSHTPYYTVWIPISKPLAIISEGHWVKENSRPGWSLDKSLWVIKAHVVSSLCENQGCSKMRETCLAPTNSLLSVSWYSTGKECAWPCEYCGERIIRSLWELDISTAVLNDLQAEFGPSRRREWEGKMQHSCFS
jgi:hypothetical protein